MTVTNIGFVTCIIIITNFSTLITS
jgi:hypothetical protein